MVRFPTFTLGHSLYEEDFFRFSKAFASILLERIPTATDVNLIIGKEQLGASLPEILIGEYNNILYNQLNLEKKAVKIAGNSLLLPFPVDKDGMAVACISGIDPLVIQRAGEDWLADIQMAVIKEFLYLKQARIDPETGLFNSANLYALLDTLTDVEMFHLVLIELPPRLRTPRDPFQYAQKAAVTLQEYAGGGTVHHLGECVFAILLPQQDTHAGNTRFGSLLVASLKREGFHRVHIGMSAGEGRAKTDDEKGRLQDRLLAEAWTALQTASRRGPFSFCDYRILAHPEKHPLKPHNDKLIRKIRRQSQDVQSFCLIEMKCECSAIPSLSHLIARYVDQEMIFPHEDRLVIFLAETDIVSARTWIGTVQQSQPNEDGKALHISAGIACYPYADFRKSEILSNCRKALLHSDFFGPGSITAFDAVSLNISGDIYYGEGDLPNAIREYRRGLVCEPGNVNLLNSLGVAYAMMNKHASARESFQKALEVDPLNFMSLYNLGLEEVLRANLPGGLQCFEKAIGAHSDDDGVEVKRDLQFQLAKLCCRLQHYDKALDLLTLWYESCESLQSRGPALRYLGEACWGLGRKVEAMVWLQKALRFNELDPEALSLLGLIYLEAGEGKDIALALCEKGLELYPSEAAIRLRLAKVQIECGLFTEALENLKKCRCNRTLAVESQFLLGRLCLRMGRRRQAKYWFGKVLQQDNIAPEILQEIHAATEK